MRYIHSYICICMSLCCVYVSFCACACAILCLCVMLCLRMYKSGRVHVQVCVRVFVCMCAPFFLPQKSNLPPDSWWQGSPRVLSAPCRLATAAEDCPASHRALLVNNQHRAAIYRALRSACPPPPIPLNWASPPCPLPSNWPSPPALYS